MKTSSPTSVVRKAGINVQIFDQTILFSPFANISGDDVEIADMYHYHTLEEQAKLCYYASKHANLAYLEYRGSPHWHHPVDTKQENFTMGMYCGTVPATCLLLGPSREHPIVQITTFAAASDIYTFEEYVIHARSASLSGTLFTKIFQLAILVSLFFASKIMRQFHSAIPDDQESYLKEHEEESELLSLSDRNSRKKLCARVRDYVSVKFLASFIPEARLHVFEPANNDSEKYAAMAMACPTTPKVYVRRAKAAKRVEIIVVRSGIDLYEFEVDDGKVMEVISPREYT